MIVGLEKSTYTVKENEGRLQVCVAVANVDICCPVAHPFSVRLQHTPGTASEESISTRKIIIM